MIWGVTISALAVSTERSMRPTSQAPRTAHTHPCDLLDIQNHLAVVIRGFRWLRGEFCSAGEPTRPSRAHCGSRHHVPAWLQTPTWRRRHSRKWCFSVLHRFAQPRQTLTMMATRMLTSLMSSHVVEGIAIRPFANSRSRFIASRTCDLEQACRSRKRCRCRCRRGWQ